MSRTKTYEISFKISCDIFLLKVAVEAEGSFPQGVFLCLTGGASQFITRVRREVSLFY